MLISIFAGVIAFILTVIGIPAFIRFYHKAQIPVNRCMRMSNNIKQKLGHQQWEDSSFS